MAALVPPYQPGLGWRPNPPDVRDFTIDRLLGARAPTEGATPSMRAWRGPVLYQDGVSACVGFAFARALYMSMAVKLPPGADVPMPAPQFIYAIGRAEQYAGMDPLERPPLVDEGCFPRLAARALKGVGFCREVVMPFDPDTINDAPPGEAFLGAYDQKALSYHLIAERGQARIEALRETLLRRVPVVYGMDVDRAFMEHRGTTPIRRVNSLDIQGGHMMCVLEVLPNGDVVTDNWWGPSWGREGIGIISADLFGSDTISDVIALDAVPPYSQVPA